MLGIYMCAKSEMVGAATGAMPTPLGMLPPLIKHCFMLNILQMCRKELKESKSVSELQHFDDYVNLCIYVVI